MLFLYSDDDVTPVKFTLVDFQCCLYSIPVLDVANLLYTCSPLSTLHQHLHQLLSIYHSSFISTLKHIKENVSYSYEDFLHDFNAVRLFGIIRAVHVTPHLFYDKRELPELVAANDGSYSTVRRLILNKDIDCVSNKIVDLIDEMAHTNMI